MPDWIQLSRDEFRAQAETFRQGIDAIGKGLLLTTEDVDDFGVAMSEFESQLAQYQAAQTALKTALAELQVGQQKVESLMRRYNMRMQSAPAIDDAKRATIGLPIRRESHRTKPHTVTGLLARAFSDGEVELRWDRGLNHERIQFMVEKRVGDGPWRVVGTVTATKIRLRDCPPGETAWFRVVASRNMVLALPSAEAVIYAGMDSQRAA